MRKKRKPALPLGLPLFTVGSYEVGAWRKAENRGRIFKEKPEELPI